MSKRLLSVVLSGGSGTPWPASREAPPKPLMQIGGSTLLQQAIDRGQACGAEELLVVTNDEPLEPNRASTGPAIALAALHCEKHLSADTVMLVHSADHLVPNVNAFVDSAGEAIRLAQEGALVVLGVPPTGPEIAFEYLEVGQAPEGNERVIRFVERPDLAAARSYLETGRYYWNSGMFCFTAAALIHAMEQHAPALLKAARKASLASSGEGNRISLDLHAFSLEPEAGIDHAVMAHAQNVRVVRAKFSWCDVRSWPAEAGAHPMHASGNTLGRQNVKQVVDILKAPGQEAVTHPSVATRPWGTYATLKEEDDYKVKRITVEPHQSLSLQYHHRRAEHWVVVQGKAKVQIGDDEFETLPGQYRYIPLKEKHRLTNIGTETLVLIEVQCGSYLGEDDIVRLADTYGRA